MSRQIPLDIAIVGGLRLTLGLCEFPYLFARCTNPYTGEAYLRILHPEKTALIEIHYFTPWKIELFNEEGLVADLELNYKNSVVGIQFATSALGDTLAWLPIVSEWCEKNEVAKAYVWTKWNFLFDKTKYPRIEFIDEKWIETGQTKSELSGVRLPAGIKLFNVLGHALSHEKLTNQRINHANPVNWKEMNMFDSQNKSFGLPSEERKPKLIQLPSKRQIQGKYVTICNETSQRIKHILKPNVWLALVYKLKTLGYQVVSVGNKASIIPEIITTNGTSFENVMGLIKDAEFHIGLSSGLSWLAWAYNIPVLMLGSFTDPGYEFTTNVVRVIDKSQTWGLFNDSTVPWDATWHYDPEYNNCDVARRISASHALQGLEVLLRHLNIGNQFQGVYLTQDGVLNPIKKLT